jgi:hypothetical protein
VPSPPPPFRPLSLTRFGSADGLENASGLKGSKERISAVKQLSQEISQMAAPAQGIDVHVVDIEGVNRSHPSPSFLISPLSLSFSSLRSLPNVTHVMEDTKGKDKLKTLEEVLVVSLTLLT